MTAGLDPQTAASDPTASVFVTANAGSGKTTTLVNRVARLLLGETPPEAILCVTYTKAAAAEMQRRLFTLLGDWSVLPDAASGGGADRPRRAPRGTCRTPAACSPGRWRRRAA